MGKKRNHLKIYAGALGIGTGVAMGLTTPAAAQSLDDNYLFGINSQTGNLVRYKFVDAMLDTIGVVQDSSGATLTGIEASAYVPRSSNIVSFWTDPSDGLTKLVYVNIKTAQAVVVGQDLGQGAITGAVAAPPTPLAPPVSSDPTPLSDLMQYDVYAVQAMPQVDFDITTNQAVPTEPFAMKVTILGSAISSGGAYDMPVTAKLVFGTSTEQPFGTFTLPITANLNDGMNPRTHVFPGTFNANTPVNVVARSWDMTDTYYNDTYVPTGVVSTNDGDWENSMTVDSNTGGQQVITLRDGDPVPNIPGFMDQNSIAQYLVGYIDSTTNTMDLGANQVVYLFELGTTDMTDPAADFQDLVVLVTFAKDAGDLPSDETEALAKLINVDHSDGSTQRMMLLDHAYDSLAAESAQMFYGTVGDELYAIDPTAGTETLVGTLDFQDIKGSGFAASALYGFSHLNNLLSEIDTATAASVPPQVDMGVADLGTVIFMRLADEPNPAPLYD